jgi:LPXTG-site transpeptidase (sortase) family protein
MRIVIPALGLDTQVKGVPYQSTNWDVTSLGASVGWLEGTSNPWSNRNTILVGHLNLHGGIAGPFENLDTLKTDSKIFVYTRTNIYTYTVSKNMVVKMTDTSVLDPNSHSQLTLITCNSLSWDPFNDIYLLRQVVVAKLLAVEDLDSDEIGDRLTFRPQRK